MVVFSADALPGSRNIRLAKLRDLLLVESGFR